MIRPGLAHHGPEDLVISLLTIIGALIVMFKIQWRLALVVAILLPIFIIVILSQRKAMRKASVNVSFIRQWVVLTRLRSSLWASCQP